MLEEMPLPGRTESEAERKKTWLALPRPARAAIRRMHNQFGPKLNEPLFEIRKSIERARRVFGSGKVLALCRLRSEEDPANTDIQSKHATSIRV